MHFLQIPRSSIIFGFGKNLPHRAIQAHCSNLSRPRTSIRGQSEDWWGELGATLCAASNFRPQIRKKSGNTPETLLEQILEFLAAVPWKSPTPRKHWRFDVLTISSIATRLVRHGPLFLFLWKWHVHSQTGDGHELPTSMSPVTLCLGPEPESFQ